MCVCNPNTCNWYYKPNSSHTKIFPQLNNITLFTPFDTKKFNILYAGWKFVYTDTTSYIPEKI